MSQEVCREEVLNAMDRSNSVTVISRPTQNRLKDYEGDALLCAFPLQFPYGFGLVLHDDSASQHNERSRRSTNIQQEYLRHLQCLAICHMHRGDFILVLHNMYERHKAVSIAYLRCLYKVGDDTIGEHFANMTVAQLQSAINRAQSHLTTQDQIVDNSCVLLMLFAKTWDTQMMLQNRHG